MAIIALEGMRFFGKHGYYDEEQTLGTEFIIDLYVETPIESAAASDELMLTVNYETLFLMCQSEMKKPAKLIETVAQRIADRINGYFPNIHGLRIRLRKMNPPIGGPVHSTYIEIETGSFGRPKLKTLKKLKELVEGWGDLRKKFEQL